MVRGGRVGGVEYAERVNAAAGLVAAGVPVAEAARVLAGRFGCSERQARRYVEVAARSGAVVVREPATVFTVKGPGSLAQWWRRRWRSFSRAAAGTIPAGERAGSRSGVRVRPPRGRGIVGSLQDLDPRRAGPQRARRPGRTVPR